MPSAPQGTAASRQSSGGGRMQPAAARPESAQPAKRDGLPGDGLQGHGLPGDGLRSDPPQAGRTARSRSAGAPAPMEPDPRGTRPPAGRGGARDPRSPSAGWRGEEAVVASLLAAGGHRNPVRYRGFVLLPQPDLGWLVRPERSPMAVLPFRTPPISLSDVKALVDWRLDGARLPEPANRTHRDPGVIR